ncbi:MAG: hypothetical protein J6A94_12045 [Lachnospiraceae bacterium]|nr:hypothetical protein [Lachnospiraceae bacterium]
MRGKKRFWYLMLALCLMVVQMPMRVQAETERVSLLSEELVADTYYKTVSDGDGISTEGASESDYNVYFSQEEGKSKLILNNAQINGQLESYASHLEIELQGRNIITNSYSGSPAAIYTGGGCSLIIGGAGELVALAAEGYGSRYSNAIAVNGDLTITGGTITALGNTAEAASCGIYMEGGNLSIKGGTLYANCALEDGKIVTKDGQVPHGFSVGIYNSSLADGKGNITIDGGTIYAYGGDASGATHGIGAEGNIVINAGTITAVGGGSEDTRPNYGIGCSKDVTINGGTIIATGGTVADGSSYGIGAIGNLAIANGKVTASGGASANGNSFGIGSNGKVTITDSELTAKGGNAGQASYGVGSDQGITIKNSSVNAASGTAPYGFAVGTQGSLFVDAKTKIEANSLGTAIGTVLGCTFENHVLYAGNSAEDASLLETIPSKVLNYKYVSVLPYRAVTVNNGSGTGEYIEGNKVTIVAKEAEAGKQFKEWIVESGEVTLDNATSSETTFTMPAGEVVVTATYEDIPAYKILSGGEGNWTQGDEEGYIITGSGDCAKFLGIKVDGNSVDPSNYTVKSGSTIVILKKSYMDTLSVGTHTLEMIWTDASIFTTFSILAPEDGKADGGAVAGGTVEKSDEDDADENEDVEEVAVKVKDNVPKTGDITPLGSLFACMLLSGAGILLTVKRKAEKE